MPHFFLYERGTPLSLKPQTTCIDNVEVVNPRTYRERNADKSVSTV